MEVLLQIFQQLVNGLSLGSIYALISLGYTMVYGIVRLINFAHGDLLTVGAFVAYFLFSWLGLTPFSFILAFPLAMLVTAGLGMLIERTAYRPLKNAPKINSLITAIGVSLFLENLMRVLPFIGTDFRRFPTLPSIKWEIFSVSVSSNQVLVIAIAAVLMVLLMVIVDHTKTGKAMRAVSFDTKAASLMGINVNHIISFTFAIGSALAAAGGILYATSYPQVEPYMGILPGLKAFVAAVLGGIGSIPGAMLGGVILGLAETLTKGFISSQLSDAVVFSILIIILMVRPAGIMGKNLKEKV